ncbi:hypothetical protein ABTX34_30210 [Streptomyces sp. NPDC096538]|uniref:hypothetical protein n=1 Tax=Streptomyces sp. NPDC096538 TaxID=3155427 RepID=UPI0033225D53
MVAVALMTATPAAASEPSETGLTFYTDGLTTPVANFPDPDGECTALPRNATGLVAWSNVTQVVAYSASDCTGQAWNLGTLRTFEAGRFLSFEAY